MKQSNRTKWKLAIFLICCLIFYFALPRKLFDTPTSYVINDRHGNLLSAAIATDGQWRFPAGDSIPEKFQHCIVQFEDKRFFWHPGIDLLALGRAISQNITEKKVISGASTITMQVIRMSRNQKRTIFQKVLEAILAFRLELRYSKSSILKLYAENAPFGSNVVGLEAAAWRYFGRAPETLSWAESATLAVLPNAPSLIHPGKNRELLLSKRNALLDRLARQGIIDEQMALLSKEEPLPDKPFPLPQSASHLLERFKKESQRNTSGQLTRLESTIEESFQQNIMKILQRHHVKNRANGILNIGALVLGVDDGDVLSYVGNISSTDAEAEQYVDMVAALRSPGSTLKPFLYAGMLNDGLILPHTLIADIPTQIGGYTPQNFDLAYDGAVPASVALSRSLNIPAVKMLQQYRYPRFQQLLKQLGIHSLNKPADHYGLAMILGGAEVTMWDLTGAYANMARTLKSHDSYDGLYNPADYHPPSYFKTGILQDEKTTNQRTKANLERSSVLDYASIYFAFQAMNESTRPESEMLWEQFSSSQKIAWKTGTSFGFRDGWAIGLTPDHVVCVWVGNADGEGRPGLTGIMTAAPILFEIFSMLPARGTGFAAPMDYMIQTAVCKESGHLAGPNCPDPEITYIPASGFKSAVCPYHRVIHTDTGSNHQISRDCAQDTEIITQKWFVLPPAMEYYYKRRHADYQELPPYLPGCEPATYRAMEMIYPRNNAKIYIPLELNGEKGKVVFTVAHQRGDARIFWHLDEDYIGETTGTHQLGFNIRTGKHLLTLIDASGNRLVQHFEILEK